MRDDIASKRPALNLIDGQRYPSNGNTLLCQLYSAPTTLETGPTTPKTLPILQTQYRTNTISMVEPYAHQVYHQLSAPFPNVLLIPDAEISTLCFEWSLDHIRQQMFQGMNFSTVKQTPNTAIESPRPILSIRSSNTTTYLSNNQRRMDPQTCSFPYTLDPLHRTQLLNILTTCVFQSGDVSKVNICIVVVNREQIKPDHFR